MNTIQNKPVYILKFVSVDVAMNGSDELIYYLDRIATNDDRQRPVAIFRLDRKTKIPLRTRRYEYKNDVPGNWFSPNTAFIEECVDLAVKAYEKEEMSRGNA